MSYCGVSRTQGLLRMQWVGALRVLCVRIAWHGKRPTSSTVKRMAVARVGNEQIRMRAVSEPGRRRARKATPANQVHAVRTVLGEVFLAERKSTLGMFFCFFW